MDTAGEGSPALHDSYRTRVQNRHTDFTTGREWETENQQGRRRSWHFWIAHLAVQVEILLPSCGFRLTMLAQGPQKRIPQKKDACSGSQQRQTNHQNNPLWREGNVMNSKCRKAV